MPPRIADAKLARKLAQSIDYPIEVVDHQILHDIRIAQCAARKRTHPKHLDAAYIRSQGVSSIADTRVEPLTMSDRQYRAAPSCDRHQLRAIGVIDRKRLLHQAMDTLTQQGRGAGDMLARGRGNYRGIELRSRDHILPACSSGTFYYAPNTAPGKTVQTRESDNHG